MAKIWNPWFKDLPPSYQTEENKTITVSSEAVNTAELILKNGAAATRLQELKRDKEDLYNRYRVRTSEIEDMNVIAWSRKKDAKASQASIQSAFRAVRVGRDELKKMSSKIDHLTHVIYYLEEKLNVGSFMRSKSEPQASTPGADPFGKDPTQPKSLKRRFLDEEWEDAEGNPCSPPLLNEFQQWLYKHAAPR